MQASAIYRAREELVKEAVVGETLLEDRVVVGTAIHFSGDFAISFQSLQHYFLA